MKNLRRFLIQQADLIAAALLMLLVFCFNPYLNNFQNNSDEGINLAKSALLSAGFDLYKDVWSDQPPLLTYMIALLWKITGQSLESARIFVFAMATILICAACRITRIIWDLPAAICCLILLLSFPNFILFSSSLLIGLPAIAFLTLSVLTLVYWHKNKSTLLLVASASFYALSVFTKLFCLIPLPGIFSVLIFHSYKQRNVRKSPGILWLSVFLALSAAICIFFISEEVLDQLLSPHISARKSINYVHRNNLSQSLCLLGFALTASLYAIIQKRSLSLYLSSWLVLSSLALFFHRPLWSHHFLLPAVPAVILSGGLISEAGRFAANFLQTKRLAVVFACLIAISYTYLTDCHEYLQPLFKADKAEDPDSAEVIDFLKQNARAGDYMLTDLPVYAFKAGILSLPETAVFSRKRLDTGYLSGEMLLKLVKERQPEFVMFKRFEFPELIPYLDSSYNLKQSGTLKLYIKKLSVCETASNCLQSETDWLKSTQALKVADILVKFQNPDGGWPKNIQLSKSLEEFHTKTKASELLSSIDNNATTAEIRLLAKISYHSGSDKYIPAIDNGIYFLLANQYESGGWPQRFPIKKDYYTSWITFNDNATINVLRLLRDIEHQPELARFKEKYEKRIDTALSKTTELILKTQIMQNGRRTGWCMQYHPHTLLPESGRAYEPASISGKESVEIVRYLMQLPDNNPQIAVAIEDFIRWLQSSAIYGFKLSEEKPYRIVEQQGLRTWARFYDIESNIPIFRDRNGKTYSDYRMLSPERFQNYEYFSSAAEKLLTVEYPEWKRQNAKVKE